MSFTRRVIVVTVVASVVVWAVGRLIEAAIPDLSANGVGHSTAMTSEQVAPQLQR